MAVIPRFLIACLGALTALAACGGPAQASRSNGITPSYDHDTGRLEKITFDRNNDGKVDAWTFMNGTTIVRAEIDDNFDGLVDRWEFYAPLDPGARRTGGERPGVLVRVEQATHGDGKVSRWEYYTGGVLTRAEEDSDGNGRIDKWETWNRGTLAAIALDTTGRGRPDRRLVYDTDGPRLEIDPAGTGQFRPAEAAGAPR